MHQRNGDVLVKVLRHRIDCRLHMTPKRFTGVDVSIRELLAHFIGTHTDLPPDRFLVHASFLLSKFTCAGS